MSWPLGRAARADDPQPAGPQAGDVFVFVDGPQAGQIVKPTDLMMGAAPILAWPMDNESRSVRDGSRLNLISLVRVDEAHLDEATKLRSAVGIVAYSAICTHAQCTVTGWNPEKTTLVCPCHQSEYDASQSAEVVFGPAQRALAALPVKIENNALIAAGGFIGRPGARST